MNFDWDQANSRQVQRNEVERDEVEQALLDPSGLIIRTSTGGPGVRYRAIGSTLRERLLTVVFTIRDGALRPLAAFETDRYTSKLYRTRAAR